MALDVVTLSATHGPRLRPAAEQSPTSHTRRAGGAVSGPVGRSAIAPAQHARPATAALGAHRAEIDAKVPDLNKRSLVSDSALPQEALGSTRRGKAGLRL